MNWIGRGCGRLIDSLIPNSSTAQTIFIVDDLILVVCGGRERFKRMIGNDSCCLMFNYLHLLS